MAQLSLNNTQSSDYGRYLDGSARRAPDAGTVTIVSPMPVLLSQSMVPYLERSADELTPGPIPPSLVEGFTTGSAEACHHPPPAHALLDNFYLLGTSAPWQSSSPVSMAVANPQQPLEIYTPTTTTTTQTIPINHVVAGAIPPSSQLEEPSIPVTASYRATVGSDAHIQASVDRRRHPPRFQCDACGRSFTRNKTFTDHKLLHSNMRSFHCTACVSRFNTQSLLDRHIRNYHHEGRSHSPARYIAYRRFHQKRQTSPF
ncbi:hypothetical protein K523DRAFT_325833 [Schizophyllum commune Tattone D]|nr:hypothetical protein K523DRAFT_325833 [Schizophyllum commune Tattone D]